MFVTVKNGESTDFSEHLQSKKIVRVWTVLNREDLEKVGPIHHQNAFLEDYIHDWNLRGNMFRFYSRVHERGQNALIYVELEDLKK